ncbi:MAG: hypothetical protein AB2989_04165 [Candidatus Symbiodolus clandestinus]
MCNFLLPTVVLRVTHFNSSEMVEDYELAVKNRQLGNHWLA